ncbi:chemotaxis protein methyltransferase CheR [Roseovarius sp. MBR-51]
MSLSRARSYHDHFAEVISRETGIKLPSGKKVMIESRLRRRVQTLGFTSLEEYFRHLFEDGGFGAERSDVIDLITTNKTDFFREPAHFRCLVTDMLPDIIARKQRLNKTVDLKFWSAACSDGSEAYTAAMLLEEAARNGTAFQYAILGTDISNRMVAAARRAIYTTQALAPVPEALRTRYTMPGQTEDMRGMARIVPALRSKTNFTHLNLMDDSYPVDQDVDIIFLRNVLIYFEPEDQARVIARLVRHLAPKGYLVVGHSESMTVKQPNLKQLTTAVYQKE